MTMVGFLVTLGKAGIVFGLLALTVKMLRRYDRRMGTGARRAGAGGAASAALRTGGFGRRRRERRVLDVVERAQLGRTASMVLVRVQDQHWVLGVTDQQVTMLLEVDLPDPEAAIDLRAAATRGPAGSRPGDVGEAGGADAGGAIGGDTTGADGADGATAERFSSILRSELVRQTRRYLPGRSRVEVLDPAAVAPDGAAAPLDGETGPIGTETEGRP